MKTIIIFCFIFCLNYSLAKADNLNLPKAMQKSWAVPDCAEIQEVYFYTNHFELKVGVDHLDLKPALKEDEKKEYNIINIKGNTYYNHITNDGIMQIGDKLTNDADEWEDMDFKNLSEYMHCSNLSNKYEREKSAIKFLRKVENNCLEDNNPKCQIDTFKAADINKDNKISRPEFKKLLKNILYLSYSSDTDNKVQKEALYFAIDNSGNKIERLNDIIFAKDKFIKKNKFNHIRDILGLRKPESKLFLSALDRVSVVMPSYR